MHTDWTTIAAFYAGNSKLLLKCFFGGDSVPAAFEVTTELRTPSGGRVTEDKVFDGGEPDKAKAYFEEQKQELILRTARQALGVNNGSGHQNL